MVWNLNDIIDERKFDLILGKTKGKIADLVKDSKACITEKNIIKSKFVKIINLIEEIVDDLNRLYGYPSLKEEKNQKDQNSAYLKSKAKSLISYFEDSVRPFMHWYKGLDEKHLLDESKANMLADSLNDLKYHYKRIRYLAKRTLKQKEEEIIQKKDINILSTIKDLRSIIETGQTYTFKDPETNKNKRYNNSALLIKNIYSNNKDIRENTYKALFRPYINNIKSYYLIYESVVKDWVQESIWRNYLTPIQVRNEENDVDDITVQNLISTTQKNNNIFQEFFKLKANYMGLKKLSRFDLYAPIFDFKEDEYSFESAKDTVFRVLKSFDNDFYDYGKKIFNKQHIDSVPLKNKSNGAFCATISPSLYPYILLNYTNRKRDMLVLAHELGHGIHSVFANKKPPSVIEAPLVLAETASTLCELLVFENLYGNETNKNLKQKLLIEKLTDTYATICRQIYFTTFEIKAHENIPKGIEISELNNLYYDNLKEKFAK